MAMKRSHEHRYASRKWIAPKRGLGPPLYLKYQRKFNKGKWAEEDLRVAVKEDHGIDEDEVHTVAAKVVENVVRLASVAAREANSRNASPKIKRYDLKSLPTIQIDTVPSPLSSPTELSPVSAQNSEEDPLDVNQIEIELDGEQTPESLSDELRNSLKDYIEELLSKAMVVAEKKLQFDEVDDGEIDEKEVKKIVMQEPPSSVPESKPSDEASDAEIRAAAEKVVEEVLSKAQETVVEQIEQFEKEVASLNFPGLPSIQIDTVKSAPPSPEREEEPPRKPLKWSFKMEDTDSLEAETIPEETPLITFDEAPENVKDAASNIVKEIVGKAIAQAEEKAVPTVPFNFVAEDVDLMKTNGPWYVRVREAFIRVLRTACFCTPRRNDS